MPANLIGLGAISTFGSSIGKLEQGLQGERDSYQFPCSFSFADGTTLTMPAFAVPAADLDAAVPKSMQRKASRLVKFAAVVIEQALADADLVIRDGSRVGLVVGTGFGPQSTSEEYISRIAKDWEWGASPWLFSTSVQNSIASALAIHLQLTGPTTTVSCFDLTTANALGVGIGWIDAGLVDYVITICCDEYYSMLAYHLLLEKQEKSRQGLYEAPSETLAIGEGASCFILAKPSIPARYGQVSAFVSASAAWTGSARSRAVVSTSLPGTPSSMRRELLLNSNAESGIAGSYGYFPTISGFDVLQAAAALGQPAAQLAFDTITCLQIYQDHAGWVEIKRSQ